MSDRFEKFMGKLTVEVEGEESLKLDLKLSEKHKILRLLTDIRKSGSEEKSLDELNILLKDIIMRNYPDAKAESVDAFLLQKFESVMTGLSVAMGWTTKEEIEKNRKKLEEKLNEEKSPQ